MKKLLLLLICSLLSNCGQSYPEEQQLFLDKINLISDKYMDVSSENSFYSSLTDGCFGKVPRRHHHVHKHVVVLARKIDWVIQKHLSFGKTFVDCTP